jgi:hypothetical protein
MSAKLIAKKNYRDTLTASFVCLKPNFVQQPKAKLLSMLLKPDKLLHEADKKQTEIKLIDKRHDYF